jgi:uncharacterized protein (TIGR03437 family)
LTTGFGIFGFTAAAIISSGSANWLSVSPASGTVGQTPTNLTVSVSPQGLAPGTYGGSIVITGQAGAAIAQTIPVTYVVVANQAPVPTRIQNAASGAIGPIAPGEILSIFGSNLAAFETIGAMNASGFFSMTLGETQVLFDNIPGALLYAAAGQINVVVPYEIAGRIATAVQVVFRGVPSNSIQLSVAPTAPGIFANQSGQAAALNANGTINSSFNPAQKGTPIVLYATGEGVTSPPGATGQVNTVNLKHPIASVSVIIGGQPAEVQYAGSAPGFISGALQVNALIPDTAPSGSAVSVVLIIGGASSQGATTIAIQ